MKLCEDYDGCKLVKGISCGPMAQIYQTVLEEVGATKKSRRFTMLWSSMSPSGNIYRYMGLQQERMRHCLDLQQQLGVLADERKDLLGGTEASIEERAARLRKALFATKVRTVVDVEKGSEEGNSTGWLPVDEFLKGGGVAEMLWGWIVCPADKSEFEVWRRNLFMALVVFLIQITSPFLIIVSLWSSKENQLKDRGFWRTLSIQQAFCVGETPEKVFTTITAVLFLMLVNCIVLNYARDEKENAEKTGRLPTSNAWATMGNIANSTCCVLLVFAMPLDFYGETGPTDIIMNALALIFVFQLDDLTGDVFGSLGEDDPSFQRMVAWNFALLSNCPVQLRDLTNSEAKTVDELWKISYDASGRLQAAEAHSLKPLQPPVACLTRIMLAPPDEASALAKPCLFEEVDFSELTVLYRTDATGTASRLPGWRAQVYCVIWSTAIFIISIAQFVIPFAWVILNKPCKTLK